MTGRKDITKQKRIFSVTASAMLILSTLLIGISIQVPNATAAAVNHTVGNLKVNMLTDYGRILSPIVWGSHQTTNDPATGVGFIGLVLDQDNYDHFPGSEDIADSFSTYPYCAQDDLTTVKNITLVIDDGTMQKSVASFQNTGAGTGDPNDILINQTAWTVFSKDWAILQWTLINLKKSSLTGVCIALELPLSQVGAGMGLGGDSGDDIDGYDAVDNVYWAQDNGGTGTCIGFASAIVSDPITHYYSQDYHPTSYNAYKLLWENDTWLYNRVHAPSATVNATPGNRTSTVGWNDLTIPAGSSRTVTLVIAANSSFANMIEAVKDAQDFYQSLIGGFYLTEFSDNEAGATPQRIELYNFGLQPTDLAAEGYFLSNDGGATALSGTWSPAIIPTYGYSVFSVTGISIGPEGDTLGLYQDLGGGNILLFDEIAYGQEGVAPDPLNGESVARRYCNATASYTDEWLRNASGGPTWGAQNDVGYVISPPPVVLNRVMFNPIDPVEGYLELTYRGIGLFDISNYRIVCDDAYIVPLGIFLNSINRFYVLRLVDMPVFFTNMNPSGDNVYLYDHNGNLLDMVGWTSAHTQGYFMCRMPDGNGTHQGYNDATSQAAGWFFDQIPSLMITEFYMDSSSAQIELYNPRGGDKVLGAAPPHWTLESSVNGGTLTGSWNSGTIPANGGYDYFTMDPGGGTPGEEGDTIGLYYTGSNLRDEVSFGIKGVAPDPLFAESTSRYWDASIQCYNDDWTREENPTWGAQNDVPAINSSSFVILNEVMFNPNVAPDGMFVVIINKNPTHSVYIGNYLIVCDDVYQLPAYPVLPGGFDGWLLPLTQVIIKYGDDPAAQPFFNNMDSSGDNVYLYDNNGRLLDMVGWNTPHTQGKSVRRIPDGNGTHQGYNDTTSEAAGWVFDWPSPPPTPPAPPTGLWASLVTSGKDVMISWNASADDGRGENDVGGYTVYKSSTGVNGIYEFEAWVSANGSLHYHWVDMDAGDGDWNNYFYIVRANDTSNNEEQNSNKVGKFVNYLVDGWNLISVPLIQVNTSKDYVLQTIEGNYAAIQGYHAGKSRPWLHWHRGKPNYFNDVIKINHKGGYYIDMIKSDYLVVAGRVPTATQIPLKAGWNLIGYPCLINKTRDEALSSITGKYNMVEYYDTTKDREVRLGPNDHMQPGLGYWIHAIENCILIL